MDNIKQDFFEKRVKPLLEYVGAIGAGIMCIAYIITVFVLINGFQMHKLLQTSVFSFVNAGVGFIIMQFLKVQGISFAKNLPGNIDTINEYNSKKIKSKEKKIRSIKYFWVTTVISDFLVKALMIALTTIGLIYIVIQGSNDWNMLLVAIFNLLMFICFGFLSLVKAYDFYNDEHIPFIKKQLEEISKNNDNQG